MNSTITRAEDTTVALKITVPWHDVDKAREEVIERLSKQIITPGFRKGSVPKNIAREKLSKEAINEETLKKVLPNAYIEAVKKQDLKPIINPRIHVEAFAEGTDLVFTAETAEEPQIELKNYKDEVKKITAKAKIILPGKEDPSTGSGQDKTNLDEIVEALLKASEIKLSKLLIEQEANKLLSQMLEELKTLGLTLDQYLSSRGKTGEQIRAEYEEKASKDIKLEFALRKIADSEKITVDQKDIEAVISTIKDENQKKEMLSNPYLLSALIRQQKTLDFLTKI